MGASACLISGVSQIDKTSIPLPMKMLFWFNLSHQVQVAPLFEEKLF